MFEGGKRYRGRAVAGEIGLKVANNENRTRSVEVIVECTLGPELGERVRYRGYVNNEKNAKTTADELRAMGWRGARWGDWSGIGSKEFTWTCMIDTGQDGTEYRRAAFPRDLLALSDKGAATEADLDALNRQLGGVAAASAPRANSSSAPSSGRSGVEASAPPDDPRFDEVAPLGEDLPF